MQPLITKLRGQYPQLSYVAGSAFSWSPEKQEITYKATAKSRTARWSLLHETGHALLDHKNYQADFELLRLELDAWEKARELAAELGMSIDQDHIEDCLDTYRDWLYKRSLCPTCGTQCMQQNDCQHYSCFNCHTVWRVSANRFGRAYRSTRNVAQVSNVFV